MSKQTWFFAVILSGGIIIAVLALSAYQQRKDYERLQTELVELRRNADQSAARVTLLENDLVESKAQMEKLRKEKEEVANAQKGLEKEMRSALDSKDITISQLQGRLTVSILDRVLFDSGQALLKPEGEQVLKKVAEVIGQYTNRQVHVIGHTDNLPIRSSPRNPYPTNWELSTGRATAAVRYLTEKAGFDPRRLGALGYGEFHPIADNSTAEGRARNRRIAIVVLPEEFAPSDVTETPKPAKEPAATPKPAPAAEEKAKPAPEASTNAPAAPVAAPAVSAPVAVPAATPAAAPATNAPAAEPAKAQ